MNPREVIAKTLARREDVYDVWDMKEADAVLAALEAHGYYLCTKMQTRKVNDKGEVQYTISRYVPVGEDTK